jgi:Fe-S cluster assembly ATP-binding protein
VTTSILKLKNLSLSFNGKNIVDDLSLDFWSGHIHAVVGPNGAGKSSLAYTIMGLSGYRERTRGEIIFQGENINELDIYQRARRGITLAWQEPARFEGLTVEKFLRASARDKSDQALRRVLEDVSIAPDQYLRRAVDKTLSGGERKKIELASLLLMRPKLVMLDEPDSGIDVASLENIFAALEQFKKTSATVILITHSPTVLKHAEHAFLICCGRLIDKGETDKIDRYFEEECIPCDHQNQPPENPPEKQ